MYAQDRRYEEPDPYYNQYPQSNYDRRDNYDSRAPVRSRTGGRSRGERSGGSGGAGRSRVDRRREPRRSRKARQQTIMRTVRRGGKTEVVRTPEPNPENGPRQSPINIYTGKHDVKQSRPGGNMLRVDTRRVNGKMSHNGYTLSTSVDRGIVSHFGGDDFNLVEFHFHSPSEHFINDRQHDLELHFVHKTAKEDKILVIGVLFKLGEGSLFLDNVFERPPYEGDAPVPISGINLGLLNLSKIFNYHGSLTTPPFTDGVRWCVAQKVHQCSRSQLRTFRSRVPNDNYRPLQPMNGRVIVSRDCMC